MKVKHQGRDIEGTEVEVLTSSEHWNEYQLADSKVLFIKSILVTVVKANETTNQNSEQLYFVKTQNIVKVK